MIADEILYKFIDYVLLNSCAVSSSGLNNGKVGMSLCLFEGSRYLKDEKLEEHAFELLREAIVLSGKTANYDFESGLTGVGFVLLYLLENRFLEGEFDELFGEQLQEILFEMNKETPFLVRQLSSVYFLFLVNKLKGDDEVSGLINRILLDTEDAIKRQFLCFEDIRSGINKWNVFNLFTEYLKLICYTNEYSRSLPVIESYSKLFDKGRVSGDFKIGYCLEKIGYYLNDDYLKRIAVENQTTFLANLHPNTIMLKERISLLFLLSEANMSDKYNQAINKLERDLFCALPDQLEKNISWMIPSSAFIPGYESGISKFLLYCFYRGYKGHQEDCSRINFLF